MIAEIMQNDPISRSITKKKKQKQKFDTIKNTMKIFIMCVNESTLAFRMSSEFGKIFAMNLKVQTGFKLKSTPYICPIIEKLINWKSQEKKQN